MSGSRIHAISLRGARVEVPDTGGGWRCLLEDIELSLERGQARSVLGASGAGKSVLARLLVGLAPRGARLGGILRWRDDDGEHRFDLSGVEGDPPRVPGLSERWGKALAYIPQGGTRNLNPALTVEQHLDRARRVARGEADRGADLDLLEEMGFHDPRRTGSLRPGALSEGMARRVLVALALLGSPDLLVADEPTTGLDPERRRRIVELLGRSRSHRGHGLLMVTHEVDDAMALTDSAWVLEDGRLVERVGFTDGRPATDPTSPAGRALIHAWSGIELPPARDGGGE